MSLKDSALAVLQRNHERNQPATSEEKTAQLDTHLEGAKLRTNNKLLIAVSDACAGLDMTPEQTTHTDTKQPWQGTDYQW